MIYKVIWSPVEIDYLKAHIDEPVNQLSLALAKSRNAINKKILELEGKAPQGKKNKKSIIGKRKDLGNQFLRSSWEANCCRWFNLMKYKWIYEPQVFFFEGIKKGTNSYCPDFYIQKKDIYVEVKGYLTAKGKTAIRRFAKYFPEEFKKLRAITGSKGTQATKFFKSMNIPIIAYYSDLTKEYKNTIPLWE